MSTETINIVVTVNPASPPPPPAGSPLEVVDGNGNPLQDGSTLTLQPLTVGEESQETLFTVSGGTPPYNIALANGSALPDGMQPGSVSNTDGSVTYDIAGTPTTEGTDSFAVTLSDSAGASMTMGTRKPVAMAGASAKPGA